MTNVHSEAYKHWVYSSILSETENLDDYWLEKQVLNTLDPRKIVLISCFKFWRQKTETEELVSQFREVCFRLTDRQTGRRTDT